MIDPLAESPWSTPATVEGFAQSAPNATLLGFASQARERGAARVLDIGCGAGRNAIPLAALGWDVVGTDLSWPMLAAAARRARDAQLRGRVLLALAPMERLPVADRSIDLVVAHGIWNLAGSAAQFRTAVREAGRAARPGAHLFVFTFSRATLPPDAEPVAGEPFVYTQFSGAPQVFLTARELIAELGAAGFAPGGGVPLTEHNRPGPGTLRPRSGPVIYEGTFVYGA